MSLIEIRQVDAHTRLGLGRIDAAEDLTARQRERKTVEGLLHAMTGNGALTIGHEPSGKPFVDVASGGAAQVAAPMHISISHTRGYAVLMLSSDEVLGVDIEYRSDRVERIASRFIGPGEPACTTDEKLLVWSAKETVYKLFSADNLMFMDMRVHSIHEHYLCVENLKRHIVVDVFYEFTDDYVLTYAVLPA